MTDQTQTLDLDAIEARNEEYTAIHLNSGEFANCSAADSANDVPALVAEVRRLTAELQQAKQQTAHDPIECDHQAEAGQIAEQMRQLRATIAAEIRHFCPDHGDADTCRMDCHCAIADEITRPAAVSGG